MIARTNVQLTKFISCALQAAAAVSKATKADARPEVLGTTQGRLGMAGTVVDDQTNNGCAMIALMISILSLLGCSNSRVAENVIDVLSREPLRRIREKLYAGQGHALVDLMEAVDELCERKLMVQPDVRIS